MTRDQILALPAGRELDRLVAEKVMGCRVKRHRSRSSGRWLYDLVVPGGVNEIDFVEPDAPWKACPRYSTDIAAAWQVVETLKGSGGGINIWIVNRFAEVSAVTPELQKVRTHSAPHAICLAALLAVCATP